MNTTLFVYAYNEIHKCYINKYYFFRPTVVKFLQLMQTANYPTLLKLCKFIRKAFII